MDCQILFYPTFSSPSQDVLQDSQWLSFCQPPTILSIHTSLLKLQCQFLLFLYQCRPFHFFKTPVLDGTNKLGWCIHSQWPWKPVLLTFFLFSVVLTCLWCLFICLWILKRTLEENQEEFICSAVWCAEARLYFELSDSLIFLFPYRISVPAGTYGVGRKESLRSEWPLS